MFGYNWGYEDGYKAALNELPSLITRYKTDIAIGTMLATPSKSFEILTEMAEVSAKSGFCIGV